MINKSFEEFFKSNTAILESPALVSSQSEEGQKYLNDREHNGRNNLQFYQDLLSGEQNMYTTLSNAKKFKTLKYNNSTLTLYRINGADLVSDYWVDHKTKTVVANIDFEVLGKIIKEVFIWNYNHTKGETDKKYKGVLRWLIVNFYLNYYDTIISDGAHSPAGKQYWLTLISTLRNTYNISIILNGIEYPVDFDNLDQYWEGSMIKSKIKISKQ